MDGQLRFTRPETERPQIGQGSRPHREGFDFAGQEDRHVATAGDGASDANARALQDQSGRWSGRGSGDPQHDSSRSRTENWRAITYLSLRFRMVAHDVRRWGCAAKFPLCKPRPPATFVAPFPSPMNVVVENLPNCLTTLKVEVDPQRVSAAWDSVTKDFGKYARIPGYRAGKAPAAMIEKKFGKEIRDEVEKKLLNDSTREAIQQHKLRVLGVQSVDDIQIGDDKTMSFTATVATHPSFDLPNYKGLPVAAKSQEVTEAEIDESIENLREQAADFIDVPERGAAMDDYIVVDYRGPIDGKAVHEGLPK